MERLLEAFSAVLAAALLLRCGPVRVSRLLGAPIRDTAAFVGLRLATCMVQCSR
jgi:hypothetical protein